MLLSMPFMFLLTCVISQAVTTTAGDTRLRKKEKQLQVQIM